ncbi:type 4a pilus biogenesis protein PilO [Candidatus Aerophobetes bacterium]|nr:type 4a pilus biogenesis protein PilO [Candidatus Aerophobetes bacterium]
MNISYKLKTIIVSVGVILFVAVVGVGFIYQPAKRKIKEIEIARKKEEEKNRLLKELDKFQKDVRRYNSRLSLSKDTSHFINYVSKLADASGVEVISIKPGNLQRENYYQKLPLDLSLKASYNELGKFISKLESSEQFILVEGMDFEKQEIGELSSSEEIKVEGELNISLFCSSR